MVNVLSFSSPFGGGSRGRIIGAIEKHLANSNPVSSPCVPLQRGKY